MVPCVHDGDGLWKSHRADVDDLGLVGVRDGALLVDLGADTVGVTRSPDDLVAGDVPQRELRVEDLQDRSRVLQAEKLLPHLLVPALEIGQGQRASTDRPRSDDLDRVLLVEWLDGLRRGDWSRSPIRQHLHPRQGLTAPQEDGPGGPTYAGL